MRYAGGLSVKNRRSNGIIPGNQGQSADFSNISENFAWRVNRLLADGYLDPGLRRDGGGLSLSNYHSILSPVRMVNLAKAFPASSV